jgi:hypothetical protein
MEVSWRIFNHEWTRIYTKVRGYKRSHAEHMPVAGFNFFSKAPTGGGTGGGGFVAYTEAYTAGSGTSVVPSGSSQLVVECYGKGGDGGTKASTSGKGGGGGSGAYSKKTFAVVAGDVGKTLTWNTNNSNNATVLGDAAATNLTAAALNMSAGPGVAAVTTAAGAGGTASGGTTNTSGNAGQSSGGGGTGGNAPGPAGGLGGAPFNDGTAPGAGGGGGNTDLIPGFGANPKIILAWT